MRGYPAPKRTVTPKKKAPLVNPNDVMPPGLSAKQAQAWIANHGSAAQKQKLIDRWGIGTWTTTENGADWGATLSWLLNGSTDANHATQIKTIGGKTYIGNDHDGYSLYTRGFNGQPTKVAANKGLTGRASFEAEPGARKPGLKPNADNFIDQFNSLAKDDPARFGQVQQLLFQAGYYGNSQPVLGSFAGIDQSAMLSAVKDAHTAGVPLQDFLADRAAKAAAQGINAAPKRVPLTVTLTDPKSIEAAVNSPSSLNASGISNASQAIGREYTPAELQGYIDKIHAGERLTQTAADNANPTYQAPGSTVPTPPGGTVVGGNAGVPSASDIDLAAKEAHPAEYQATHMGEQASRIYQILTAHAPGGVAPQ